MEGIAKSLPFFVPLAVNYSIHRIAHFVETHYSILIPILAVKPPRT